MQTPQHATLTNRLTDQMQRRHQAEAATLSRFEALIVRINDALFQHGGLVADTALLHAGALTIIVAVPDACFSDAQKLADIFLDLGFTPFMPGPSTPTMNAFHRSGNLLQVRPMSHWRKSN